MGENVLKKLSLMPAGLRYKLLIVFALMSIIPLLICVYIATNFVFPYMNNAVASISVVIAITLFIALLGYILAKQMVEPIIDVALEARLIAGGDFEHSIEVAEKAEGTEIADIAHSLNFMTQKIRENIGELKSYGDKTREINAEIHKKVMVLSGLLQVGNLISAGSELKTVMDILIEKVSLLDGTNPAVVFIVDKEKECLVPVSTVNLENVESAKMPVSLQHGVFARLRAELKDIIIDKRYEKKDEAIDSFRALYKVRNAAIIPILTRGTLEGVIILGNNMEGFEYKPDDIELLHVFAKQTAIAIENDRLLKKTEELGVRDNLTQLYNNKYIRERLEEEIKRAVIYQRPCSFILFNIDNFRRFCEEHGRPEGEAALKKIAKLIASELTPVDKAGRFGDDEFALILPERDKKEAKEIADELRQKIAQLVILPQEKDEKRFVTVTGGLSENPVDGVGAKELIEKAQRLLKEAKQAQKNTVKV